MTLYRSPKYIEFYYETLATLKQVQGDMYPLTIEINAIRFLRRVFNRFSQRRK